MLKKKKRKIKKHLQDGLTLIEFLVYSVIVSMFVGALVFMSINIIQGNAHTATVNDVSNNMKFALGRITYHIRQADGFNIPNDETLELIIENEDNITFFLNGESDDILKIQRGENDPEALIDYNIIEVVNLTFKDVSYEEAPGTIKIELTLKRKNPLERSIYHFQTTSHITETLTSY